MLRSWLMRFSSWISCSVRAHAQHQYAELSGEGKTHADSEGTLQLYPKQVALHSGYTSQAPFMREGPYAFTPTCVNPQQTTRNSEQSKRV